MFRSFLIVFLLGPIALSQVRISTPGTDFKSYGRISAQITNTGKITVSYCVEFGQISLKAGTGTAEDIEHTPIPFHVQKQNGSKWGTLMIGPDIGSSRHAVVLKAGESQQYPFRLSDRGRMRLVLDYWHGESDRVCEYPAGKKATRSNIFVVN
jgi:hypothetical protein